MNPLLALRAASLLALFGAITPAARAHEDPMGDVHPQVVVEDGRYSVYFRNNSQSYLRATPEMRAAHGEYRMVFSAAGNPSWKSDAS